MHYNEENTDNDVYIVHLGDIFPESNKDSIKVMLISPCTHRRWQISNYSRANSCIYNFAAPSDCTSTPNQIVLETYVISGTWFYLSARFYGAKCQDNEFSEFYNLKSLLRIHSIG